MIRPCNYIKECPTRTGREIETGSIDRVKNPKSLKVFEVYGNKENIEKLSLAALKASEINPSARIYDFAMRKFLLEEFGEEAVPLTKKWRERCWRCGNMVGLEELKTCSGDSGCGMAKYCDKECQRRDWKEHRILHKEMENAKPELEDFLQ